MNALHIWRSCLLLLKHLILLVTTWFGLWLHPSTRSVCALYDYINYQINSYKTYWKSSAVCCVGSILNKTVQAGNPVSYTMKSVCPQFVLDALFIHIPDHLKHTFAKIRMPKPFTSVHITTRISQWNRKSLPWSQEVSKIWFGTQYNLPTVLLLVQKSLSPSCGR